MSTHRRTGDGGSRGFLTPGKVLVLLLLAATLVFVFQNTARTEVRLLVPIVTMPLWVALLIPGVIGLLSGMYLVRRR
ncbi:DUF1049 domain-containing protein [Streptomyces atacamensis]|uniref:DUF1049 domain-containing protein n=1 Tax=Streptomyces atacamensis TaxID=531966 RepID=UPI002188D0BE|nr:DUF1049 domain-containing protein [Streptomyces radiopugnans]